VNELPLDSRETYGNGQLRNSTKAAVRACYNHNRIAKEPTANAEQSLPRSARRDSARSRHKWYQLRKYLSIIYCHYFSTLNVAAVPASQPERVSEGGAGTEYAVPRTWYLVFERY
jgi:hypothetical protein